MSRSNARRNVALLSSVWLSVLGLVGCSPCHTGHTEVSHYNASSEVKCSDYSDLLTCTTETDPEHCSAAFICDLRCDTVDTGRQEAHPAHPTLHQIADKVDARCGWDGTRAWLK